ncbi:MAG: RNA 2',3'-cyclic phosphodiesterase [Patescibacteria group bacterium]
MNIRSFVALDLDQAAREKLEVLISSLKKDFNSFRFLDGRSVHLTLRFLGNISPEEIEESRKILIRIAASFSPFSLEFDGFTAFPSLSEAKVLALTVKNRPELTGLFEAVKKEFGILAIGLEEKRKFVPHLTLGRARNEAEDITNLEKKKINGCFQVSALSLMKSLPASRYEIIQSFSLCQK